jgi:uncharacterized OB-fold protein
LVRETDITASNGTILGHTLVVIEPIDVVGSSSEHDHYVAGDVRSGEQSGGYGGVVAVGEQDHDQVDTGTYLHHCWGASEQGTEGMIRVSQQGEVLYQALVDAETVQVAAELEALEEVHIGDEVGWHWRPGGVLGLHA